VAVFGGLLLVDFLISLVMLFTDKNLQSDFGVHPAPQYYIHWYGVLAMGALDLILGIALLAIAVLSISSQPAVSRLSARGRKGMVVIGLAWTIVAILAMVGIVTSYSQVGFTSMSQFEQYLFGVNAYPGALSYIPWLYDLLLVAYIVTALVGVVAFWGMRSAAPTPAPDVGAH